VTFTPLKIQGAWVYEPTVHRDPRGSFSEVLRGSELKSMLGRPFEVRQVNQSISSKGVIRGIHMTDSTEGQAKFISCPAGAFWDVVVDLREDSQTYGQWDATLLSSENRKSMLILEGLGHAFLSLQDETVAFYLCTSEYNPSAEITINPLDETLGISFSKMASEYSLDNFILSEKDRVGARFLR
jgi:dTDP-4-dehydrorhamnose 3,5-epimerase